MTRDMTKSLDKPKALQVYVLRDPRHNIMKRYVHSNLSELSRRLHKNSGRVLSQEVRLGNVEVVLGVLTPRDFIIV